MAVVGIQIGPKRVYLTAYCPEDEVGLLASEYAVFRAAELLDGTSEAELRAWAIARDPEAAQLFAALDAGWRLPKNPPDTIDPSNPLSELRIVRHLIRERIEQCGGR